MVMKDTKYVPIRETVGITLSTTGAEVAVGIPGLAIEQDVFITRSDIIATLTGFSVADIESLIFGLADGSLTDVEVAECLNTDGPLHSRDNDNDETSRRRVQIVGIMNEPFSAGTAMNQSVYIQHKTRMGFNTGSTAGWKWWAYNPTANAFVTGATLKLLVLHHARWL